MKRRRPHDFNSKALEIIEKFNAKAVKDDAFRAEAFRYFSGTPGYSTIKLRDLCREVGYDYWANLSTSNAINILDTVSARSRADEHDNE